MDPIASLRPVGIVVQLGDWEYEIAPRGAAQWIEAHLQGSASAIIPGMFTPEDRAVLRRDWVLGNVSTDEILGAARLALGTAGGRRWWEVSRLVSAATDAEAWPLVAGDMARRGVDIGNLSLGAFCDAVYAFIMHNADEEKRLQARFEISRPPEGVDLDELYDEDAATADFEEDLIEQSEDR